MKYIKKAFSLIELIVVISIITITTSSWVFYFFDYVKNQEISQKLTKIEDEIIYLDNQIKNFEIYDYEVNFNTSNTWSKLFTIYKNIFDSKNQKINIINESWSWIIKTYPNSWSGTIKIYKNNKLYINNEINRSIDYTFNFNEEEKYKIKWTLSWETLNEIELNYYSEENVILNNKNKINLIKISEDKNSLDLWNLSFKNIWWIKKFYTNWTEITSNEIYLLFENNWKEKHIKISK